MTCKHMDFGICGKDGACLSPYCESETPDSLRLADRLDTPDEDGFVTQLDQDAAAELRRLHAENEDFRATCDHLTRENAGQLGEIVALKEQRDELLEALEKIATSVEIDTLRSAIECARAAIAKAEGEK